MREGKEEGGGAWRSAGAGEREGIGRPVGKGFMDRGAPAGPVWRWCVGGRGGEREAGLVRLASANFSLIYITQTRKLNKRRTIRILHRHIRYQNI